MLKRAIKYEDYNGDPAEDVHYFNISKPELIEMEVEEAGGLSVMIEACIEAKDHKTLIKLFKKIVLEAYGVKSEDGKRFIKSEELRREFSQTAAYNALFIELATDDEAAATFLKGVLPKDMVDSIGVAMGSSNGPKPVPNP